MNDSISTQGSLFDETDSTESITATRSKSAIPTLQSAPKPKYLIDANCLITPYNDYYRPSFTLSEFFWNTLYKLVENRTVGLLRPVWNEANQGGEELDDALKQWLDSVKSYVIEPLQIDTIIDNYKSVLAYLSDQRNFAKKLNTNWYNQDTADPWLIATAKIYNSTIITFEVPLTPTDPKPWKKTKIPNIAELAQIRWINLFEFMQEVALF